MTDTIYTYDISSETANGRVNTEDLENEIQASNIIVGVRRIDTISGSKPVNGVITAGSMNIVMKDTITKPDLDAIVLAHQGNEIIQADLVDLNLPTTADGTLQTSKQQLKLGRASFKEINSQSEKMNINGTPTGVITNIFNGQLINNWTLEGPGSLNSESNYSDGYGYDSGMILSANQNIIFDNESDIDLSSYSILEFFIQLKSLSSSISITVGWHDGYNEDVGIFLDVRDYVSNLDLDEWKKVTIPLDDFGLHNNNVRKLVFSLNQAAGSRIWLDNVDLLEGSGPYIFRVSSPTNDIYNVEKIVLEVTAPDAGWSTNSFANITNGLTNGLLFRHRQIDNETFWSFNCKNNTELFGQLTVLNSINFNDDEQTVIFALEPNLSSVILVDDDEFIEIVVRDNLSSITSLRAYLHYGVERVS